ncbi:MAG: hypothetical protein QXN93_06285 [Methanomassiliicoccales archaeon]
MLLITHLLFIAIIIHMLKLDRNEIFVLLLFGVLIDIDHLFGIPTFIKSNGISGIFDIDALLSSPVQWKSILHSPMAIIIVAPASISFRYSIPIIAWCSHLVMDFVQIELLGVLSLAEMILILVLFFIYVFMEVREFRIKCSLRPSGVRQFISWELGKIRNLIVTFGSKRSCWKTVR